MDYHNQTRFISRRVFSKPLCNIRRNGYGRARPDGAPVNLAYHVSCRKCRASDPIAPSAEEAVKGWEHRAPPRPNEEPPALLPELEFEGDQEQSNDPVDVRACRIK